MLCFSLNGEEKDMEYESKMAQWKCKLSYGTSRPHVSASFAHCFKHPSQYCRQHAVSMNGCKQYKNMGLYCCSMQTIDKKLTRKFKNYESPEFMTREQFLSITSNEDRALQMFLFFAMDVKIGNIKSKEEMAAFISLVMMDTHFLTNMEEHLSKEIMVEFEKHKYFDHIKYIGRGALHVKGLAFYQWISTTLNAFRASFDNVTEDQIKPLNFVDLPETLLFPTMAFQSAAITWRYSYSTITNHSKSGQSFSELSDGDADNLAQILYHLKGNIVQLPKLLNIWKRVRLVLNTRNPSPVMDIPQIGLYSECMYEPLCRGMVRMDPVLCKPKGIIPRIACEVCPRPLRMILIIADVNILSNTDMFNKLVVFLNKFISKTRKVRIQLAYQAKIGGNVIFSNEYNKGDNIAQFLIRESSNAHIISITSLIRASAKQLNLYDQHHVQHAILLVTEQITDQIFDQYLHDVWLDAELRGGISTYGVYYRHNRWLHQSLFEGIQSKLYHMDSDAFIDGFCNDPQVLTLYSTRRFILKKNEKRSFIVRMTKDQRKANFNFHQFRGQTKMIHIRKQEWKIPFDATMNFNLNHSVRASLNIIDDHSRFKGDDVILHVTDHEDPDNSYEFLPESYDVFVEFEGVRDDNLMEIRVERYTKKEKLSVSDNTHKSLQGYFELSCILVTIILFFTCLLYHPFSLVIAQKVKYHLKRLSGGPLMTSSLANQMRQRKRSPCPVCSQKFPEENEYNSLYEPRHPRARSVSAHYHREVRFQSQYYLERNRKMCSECTERKDLSVISRIHFLRLLCLIGLELILIFWTKDIGVRCRISSGILAFIINFIMFVCLSEMLCYSGLKEVPRFKSWWFFGFLFCLTLSLGTELTRVFNATRIICWPIDSTIQGRVVLVCCILIALVILSICIYYFICNGRQCHTKTGYTLCLIFIVLVLVLIFNIVGIILKPRDDFVIAFIFTNILLALTLFLFSLSVQSKANDWKVSKFLNCGLSSGNPRQEQRVTEIHHTTMNQDPFDRSCKRGYNKPRSGSPTSEVTIKTIITMVTTPDEFEQNDPHYPTYNSDSDQSAELLSHGGETPMRRPNNLPLIAEHNNMKFEDEVDEENNNHQYDQ
ncbi:uncharacterized protein [Clytia hemisphaerica]|uniref:uncharacterized protein isoform X2 n=1 Tax=Clytia hemisphaerica TaxID=252671 RepID=UPI0034D7AC9F